MQEPESSPFSEADWERFKEELLARAKEIARRVADGVRRLTGDDHRRGPSDPPGDVPAFG